MTTPARLTGSRDRQNTVDLDFQHHLTLGSRQDIVWGLGSRVADLYLGPGYGIVYAPPSRTDVLLSTFFQDQVKITERSLFTFGSKFEHNDYTGFEFEPSAQLVWNPTARQSVWLSAARAIRQPDAIDASIRDEAATFPTGPGSFGVVAVIRQSQSRRPRDSPTLKRAIACRPPTVVRGRCHVPELLSRPADGGAASAVFRRRSRDALTVLPVVFER